MVSPSGARGAFQSTAAPISDEDTKQLARELVAHGFAPRLQARHIGNHNLAERMYLARQALGEKLGLDNEVLKNITPYPTQPGNHTLIYNDTQPLVAMLGALVQAFTQTKQEADPVTQPAPPAPQPTPAPSTGTAPAPAPAPAPLPTTPVDSILAAKPWRKWLWPIIAGLAVSGGGAGWYLWPRSEPPVVPPSDVNADFNVEIR